MRRLLAVVIGLCWLCPIGLYAQSDRRIVQKLPQIDRQRWHFGFILGMDLADFTTTPSGWVDKDGNTWYSASAGLSPAFRVGLIADLRCCEYLNVRCTPSLSLGERRLNYTGYDAEGNRLETMYTTGVSVITMDVPLYVKYSAKRYGNFRPYILVGGGPLFNLNLNPDVPLLLNMFDVEIAFGVGFHIYTEYFKFCPEIKFGLGLLDALNQFHPEIEGTLNEFYTRSVNKMTSRILSITFNFE